MAKERQKRRIELESIVVELPETIRHGEHRRIERMTIRLAADDYNEIKETFGGTFEEIEARASDPDAIAAAETEDMNDHEVTASLVILAGLSQDEVDDIDHSDFDVLRNTMQGMYRRKTDAERDEGKASSVPNMKAIAR
jgi:hypothetical protein